MVTELPTKRSVVQQYNPKLIILFGKPKVGKSTLMASIDNNLIVDLDDGYRSLSVMNVVVKDVNDYFQVKKLLEAKQKELEGKKPYKFITLDNSTRIEELALGYAAHIYRTTTPMGASFGVMKDAKNQIIKDKNNKPVYDPKADVRLLPNGAGYTYLRKAVKEMIEMFVPYCDTLILVAHVKDKMINRNGTDITELSVDLGGKLGDIICGLADAVGLIYREGKNTILSFEGGDGTIKEARPLHLRGKSFVVATSDENNEVKVDLSKVFI